MVIRKNSMKANDEKKDAAIESLLQFSVENIRIAIIAVKMPRLHKTRHICECGYATYI